ncbi:hypothetical protein BGZ98_009544 [Dissophora globulifera]|nr:hypothetical protein BGZ98_009544 [Dissophora globulifera]
MNKYPFTESLLKTSLNKAISPASPTLRSSSTPALTLRPRLAAMTTDALPSPPSTPTSLRPSTMSLWSTITLACIAILSVSTFLPLTVDAAPAKHTAAPDGLVNAMSFSLSDSSALPLQLQIEARVAGKQQLAYLPTTGPSMDFYYLNYRPTYTAGESTIDFWMLTPKGTPAPKTGSLELFDEYGKVRLAVLVPEGTEIPKGVANKNEPFLWKSWKVPKTLEAEFDFSDKFRVVLKTSDSATAAATKNMKRWDDYDATLFDFMKVKKNKPAAAAAAAATTYGDVIVVQDRQFKIKDLQATPGGSPNPAKVNVNSVAAIAPESKNTAATYDHNGRLGTGTGISSGTGIANTRESAPVNTHDSMAVNTEYTSDTQKSDAMAARVVLSSFTTYFFAVLVGAAIAILC